MHAFYLLKQALRVTSKPQAMTQMSSLDKLVSHRKYTDGYSSYEEYEVA